MTASVIDGIIVGASGGAIAGLTLSVVQYARDKVLETLHKRRIHKWLCSSTRDEAGKQARCTKEIASWTNLTEDRVRYLCSTHPRVFLVLTGGAEKWSTLTRKERSYYEDHEPKAV